MHSLSVLNFHVLQAEVTKDPVRISSALPPRLIAETKNGAGAVETLLLRRIESNFVHFFHVFFRGGECLMLRHVGEQKCAWRHRIALGAFSVGDLFFSLLELRKDDLL